MAKSKSTPKLAKCGCGFAVRFGIRRIDHRPDCSASPQKRYAEVPVAKPRTKLPKVWLRFLKWGSDHGVSVYLKRPWYWGGTHQYAPIQPQRKCVWTENDPNGEMPGTFDGACGVCWYIDLSIASKKEHFSGLRFCPKCGGRITRRSPR